MFEGRLYPKTICFHTKNVDKAKKNSGFDCPNSEILFNVLHHSDFWATRMTMMQESKIVF